MEKKISKSDGIRLALFAVGSVLLFFLAPYVLGKMPEEPQEVGMLFLVMIINQIFVGAVGWQATHLPKYGIYAPAAVVAVYLLSTIVLYGQANFSMEFSYLETGYIIYFLKKLLTKRQAQKKKEEQKPFPKSVTHKR